jgi:branched-chain amino acid transport system ATP-binding protein
VTRILAFRDGSMIADGAPGEVMRDAQVASAVLRGKAPAAVAKAGAA